ncbi:MAG TPA: DNA polymerase IV [Acidimicrobiales bacterium]|nr:DNA polymerase IV [Acidimicrobiales bacterium]
MTAAGILHVDMDAFYVSVELSRDPSLRGKPVVVGGAGNRGVVAAASYEARSYGVHSAMPSARARRLCPDAVFLAGDHGYYAEVSGRVMAIFGSFTPLVEPLSLDEAFLDVRGATRLHGDPVQIAHRIRAKVLADEQLTCSVGVAPNKFLAKLASEAAKPRASRRGPVPGLGVKVVDVGEELAFLHPLPVQALWGVGPATLERLRRLGVQTVADLAALPLDNVRAALGDAAGRHLHALAHARDDRAVVPVQKPKSIGHEETYAYDHHDRGAIDAELVRLADAVAARLRRAGFAGRTVTIKVRFHDFTTITRSVTVADPVDAGTIIARAAKALAASVDPAPGVRLLGVSVSALTDRPSRQLSLTDEGDIAWSEVDGAVDRIRARFGDRAIGPAVLAGRRGLRVKRQGDTQWGPNEPGPGASGAGSQHT